MAFTPCRMAAELQLLNCFPAGRTGERQSKGALLKELQKLLDLTKRPALARSLSQSCLDSKRPRNVLAGHIAKQK